MHDGQGRAPSADHQTRQAHLQSIVLVNQFQFFLNQPLCRGLSQSRATPPYLTRFAMASGSGPGGP
jgi:hypothetical protein